MRHHGAATIPLEAPSDPRPKHNGAGKCHHTADRVDHRRSGEIMKAHSE